jgi:anti-sigma factor RsiW
VTADEERLMRYLDGEADANERGEVERWLAASPEARAALSSLELVRRAVHAIGEDVGARGEGIADAVMAALEGPAAGGAEVVSLRRSKAAASRAPSIGRRFLGLAPALGLGLAAAAAVAVYFRPVPSRPSAAVQSSAPTVTVARAPAAEALEQGPEPARWAEPGASIESVDFGARDGTIFMVSGSDSDEAETPVVWLMDEAAPTEGRMAPL